MKNIGKTTTFSKRLFLSMFSMSLVVFVFGLLFIFRSSYKSINSINQANKEASQKVTANNLNNRLMEVDTVIQTAFSQNNSVNDLSANLTHNTKANSNIRHALSVAKVTNDMVSGICYVDSDGCIIKIDTVHGLPYRTLEECEDYFAIQEGSGWKNSYWYFNQQDPSQKGESALVNTRRVRAVSPKNRKDMLLNLYLSEKKLCDSYSFLGSNSYIVNEYGTIVSAIDKQLIGKTADSSVKTFISSNRDGDSGSVKGEGINNYIVSYIPTISSYLVTNIGIEVFDVMKYPVTFTSIAVLIAGLILSIVWSRGISLRLTKPILKLKNAMEKAGNGDMSIRSEIDRNDEIGYLALSFNELMDKQEAHIRQIHQQQQITMETELRMLQMQINPHLLYNTLDSALFLVEKNKMTEAGLVLNQLSDFFKLSLQSGNKVVTIEKEIEFAWTYITIQNSCRMKNFHLRVTGDADILKCRILHMLIQPIIENAVLHGFEGSYKDGTITISLGRDDGQIIISITDDGMGMDEEELEMVRKRMDAEEPPAKGFALWNITKRARLFTKLEKPIEVFSEFGEFTTVVIHIPEEIGE